MLSDTKASTRRAQRLNVTTLHQINKCIQTVFISLKYYDTILVRADKEKCEASTPQGESCSDEFFET